MHRTFLAVLAVVGVTTLASFAAYIQISTLKGEVATLKKELSAAKEKLGKLEKGMGEVATAQNDLVSAVDPRQA